MNATNDYVAPNGNGVKLPDNKELAQMSYRELFAVIPKRLVALVGKLIGVKMLILYGATALFLLTDRFPVYAWLIVAGIVIFGREFLKVMKDIKK